MTTTGRKPKPDKLIARTVRNRPDVDAVLVAMAQVCQKGLAEVLREACEEKARKASPSLPRRSA